MSRFDLLWPRLVYLIQHPLPNVVVVDVVDQDVVAIGLAFAK